MLTTTSRLPFIALFLGSLALPLQHAVAGIMHEGPFDPNTPVTVYKRDAATGGWTKLGDPVNTNAEGKVTIGLGTKEEEQKLGSVMLFFQFGGKPSDGEVRAPLATVANPSP